MEHHRSVVTGVPQFIVCTVQVMVVIYSLAYLQGEQADQSADIYSGDHSQVSLC